MHRERLARLLEDRGYDECWLARPPNFAWLARGDNRVDRHAEMGVAAAGFDGTTLTVLTDTIEADRLRAEELPGNPTVETVPWYEATLPEAIAARASGDVLADVDVPGADRFDASELRQPLTDDDVATYRELGREAAVALESTCREFDPTTTEREAAAAITAALARRGIDAPVVLVGGERRAALHRHYTPAEEPLEGYVLCSVTAYRDGLYASLTRTVAFDPPEWLAERHRAAARVEATALAATRRVGRAGGTAGDVFDAIRRAYRECGHPGEWREHHQGGAAGYAGREWFATPDGDEAVWLPMGYAWNPTVQGTKSEDTHLVSDGDLEALTTTGAWPTERVEPVGDGPALERPVPLGR